VSSARNSGLKEATGKWIYFADADDKVNMDDLGKMIIAGNAKETDIVISDYFAEHIQTGVINKISCKLPYDMILNRDYIEQTIMRRYFTGDNVGLANLWNKIYKREIIERNKIAFDEKRTHGEDWKFNINYFQVANTAIALDTTVYTYQLDGSQSYSKYSKGLGYGFVDGTNILENLIKKYDIQLEPIEKLEFMNRVTMQYIAYLLLPQCSVEEKKLFLKNKNVRSHFRNMAHLSLLQLGLINRSRRERIVFALLSIGLYKLPLALMRGEK
jgi:glycosyltransferase involved in cell wall biosynthesis